MLVVAGGLVLVVCGDDDLVAGIDRIVFIIDCVSGANFWSFLIMLSSVFPTRSSWQGSYSVQCYCERSAFLLFLGFSRMVYYGLVILKSLLALFIIYAGSVNRPRMSREKSSCGLR